MPATKKNDASWKNNIGGDKEGGDVDNYKGALEG